MKKMKKIKQSKRIKYLTLENISIFSAILSIILFCVGVYLLPSWLGSRMLIVGSIFLWIFILTAFLIAIK